MLSSKNLQEMSKKKRSKCLKAGHQQRGVYIDIGAVENRSFDQPSPLIYQYHHMIVGTHLMKKLFHNMFLLPKACVSSDSYSYVSIK